MALKSVKKGGTSGGTLPVIKSFSKFAKGEEQAGYFMGFEASTKYAPSQLLVFQTAEGEVVKVAPAGQLSFFYNDVQSGEIEVTIGAWSVLMQTGTYVNKRGSQSPRYDFKQDTDNMIEVKEETTTATAAKTSSRAKIDAMLETARQKKA